MKGAWLITPQLLNVDRHANSNPVRFGFSASTGPSRLNAVKGADALSAEALQA